jgi:hypothetical protein
MAPRNVPEQPKEQLLPTPPVGWIVGWRRKPDDEPYAAIVTKQEGPGRLEVHIFPPRTQFTVLAHFKNGVFWAEHQMHKDNPHNAQLGRNGCWSYIHDTRIPDSHYDIHRQENERRDLARQRADEEFRREAERRERPLPAQLEDLPTPVPLV